jgi:hypothetical protein
MKLSLILFASILAVGQTQNYCRQPACDMNTFSNGYWRNGELIFINDSWMPVYAVWQEAEDDNRWIQIVFERPSNKMMWFGHGEAPVLQAELPDQILFKEEPIQ